MFPRRLGLQPARWCRLPVLGACFLAMAVLRPPGAVAADWPGWRGPGRDGHAAPGGPALTSLPAEPRRVWRLKIGDGLAS
ncbi:MAG: hypothetical protein ACKOET_08975, partial [Verrucomicrobiota bacterium]